MPPMVIGVAVEDGGRGQAEEDDIQPPGDESGGDPAPVHHAEPPGFHCTRHTVHSQLHSARLFLYQRGQAPCIREDYCFAMIGTLALLQRVLLHDRGHAFIKNKHSRLVDSNFDYPEKTSIAASRVFGNAGKGTLFQMRSHAKISRSQLQERSSFKETVELPMLSYAVTMLTL